MSGINAISASMSHAASGADATAEGFITGDQVALTVAPTGTNYQWALSVPSGSNPARVRFAGDDGATASFVPDVPGVYGVSVVVDGTSYALRIGVVQLAQATALESLRLLPIADSQVPPPAVGVALYYSSTSNALVVKDAANAVHAVNLT